MLAEFWKGFCATINDAAPKIVEASQEPNGVYYVRSPDGELKKAYAEKPRHREVIDVPSLFNLVESMSSADSTRKLFLSHGNIRCLIDDQKPDCLVESVMLRLVSTGEYSWLLSAFSGRPDASRMNHKEFMMLLRTTLRHAVDPAVRSKFQSLRVTSKSDVRSESTNSKASLGREVEQAAMLGDEDIPEYFDVTCSLFRQFPDSKHEFRVYVTVDHDNGCQFILTPDEREMEAAFDAECRRIQELLESQHWNQGETPVVVRGCA